MSISGDGYSVAPLTNFPGTVSGSRMGRPPLGVKETKVRLTLDQIARIDAIAGPNRMAQFIRDAVENELKRREAEKPKT